MTRPVSGMIRSIGFVKYRDAGNRERFVVLVALLPDRGPRETLVVRDDFAHKVMSKLSPGQHIVGSFTTSTHMKKRVKQLVDIELVSLP